MLQNTGLVKTIEVCRNATDAIHFLNSRAGDDTITDIIFLDLNMPEMDGWEFLENYQWLITRLRKIPLLYVVSSSIEKFDYDRAMNIQGVDGYLNKPLEAKKIMTLLKEARC